LTHDWNGEVKGLKEFPPETWPTNLPLVFWAFRTMVGMGMLRSARPHLGPGCAQGGAIFTTRRGSTAFAVAMGPSGLVAFTAGGSSPTAGGRPLHRFTGCLRTAGQRLAHSCTRGGRLVSRVRGRLFRRVGAGHLVPVPASSRRTPHPASGTAPKRGSPIRSAGITPGAIGSRPSATQPRNRRSDEHGPELRPAAGLGRADRRPPSSSMSA
jgi:cytochrome d ubiquinol oxidase subunit I